jgi:hypothetical protein
MRRSMDRRQRRPLRPLDRQRNGGVRPRGQWPPARWDTGNPIVLTTCKSRPPAISDIEQREPVGTNQSKKTYIRDDRV